MADKKFKPHMMYSKSGKGVRAKTHKEHLSLKAKGLLAMLLSFSDSWNLSIKFAPKEYENMDNGKLILLQLFLIIVLR